MLSKTLVSPNSKCEVVSYFCRDSQSGIEKLSLRAQPYFLLLNSDEISKPSEVKMQSDMSHRIVSFDVK